MQIRKLFLTETHDFELLTRLIGELYTELFGAASVPSAALLSRLREQLAARDPAHWAFVGTDARGREVALATLAESFSVFAHGHYGIINELWVRSDARSHGRGAEMIRHCQAFGRQRGWHRIDVSAPPNAEWDRSFDFYVKQGFVLTGRKLRYLLD